MKLVFLVGLVLLQGCANKELQNLGLLSKPASQVITVQGQASLENGTQLLARKLAFKDAMRKASAQAHRTSTEALLGSTKVVDEWVADNIYHIQLVSVVSEGQYCNSPYRKRIVVTGFPIVSSGQISANETQDLYSGIPREMMNILMETGDFIGRNETRTALYSRPDMAPEMIDDSGYQQSSVVDLAMESSAQFVLSGVIRDLEVESTEYIRGSGLFAEMKSMMRDFVARRGVGIDVYVHDGLSGALLFQHRYTDRVIGDVWVPSGYSVGSERFKSTPTGHKISQIIQMASHDVGLAFACYPFSAKVIKVENNKVYIAAGAQNRIKKGESLVVYASTANVEMQEQQLVGVVIIKDVQAGFSVGEMEVTSDLRNIRSGDLVKSW